MQLKVGVTVLVFALHALYSKGFLPNYARRVRNLINKKIVVILRNFKLLDLPKRFKQIGPLHHRLTLGVSLLMQFSRHL